MNTTENNKLIVEFMQLKPTKVNTDFYALAKNHVHITGKNPEIVINGFSECAKFHSDWNWLMEVVEKCLVGEAEHNDINIQKAISEIYESLCSINISNTYKACVEFIKLHNQQNN
jgi:hypothetical protein